MSYDKHYAHHSLKPCKAVSSQLFKPGRAGQMASYRFNIFIQWLKRPFFNPYLTPRMRPASLLFIFGSRGCLCVCYRLSCLKVQHRVTWFDSFLGVSRRKSFKNFIQVCIARTCAKTKRDKLLTVRRFLGIRITKVIKLLTFSTLQSRYHTH